MQIFFTFNRYYEHLLTKPPLSIYVAFVVTGFHVLYNNNQMQWKWCWCNPMMSVIIFRKSSHCHNGTPRERWHRDSCPVQWHNHRITHKQYLKKTKQKTLGTRNSCTIPRFVKVEPDTCSPHPDIQYVCCSTTCLRKTLLQDLLWCPSRKAQRVAWRRSWRSKVPCLRRCVEEKLLRWQSCSLWCLRRGCSSFYSLTLA